MAKGRILRLRGLPWSAGVDDVRAFLGEHKAVDVFLRKRGEKSTGEAFVEFETVEEAIAAQADRNHQDLGQRYIEIFPTDSDSMKGLRGEVEEHDTGWVVRLRGLPFTATAGEVLHFFSGLEVVGGVDGVVFTWGRDGRPLGEAYVEFPSEEVQQEAMRRDRNKMGQRYIEIFKSTRLDKQARSAPIRQSDPGTEDWGMPSMMARGSRMRMSEPGEGEFGRPFMRPLTSIPPLDGSVLQLRGLPYTATASDVAQFFAEFGIKPESVQIMVRLGREGPQGTGMAHVHFPNPAEAEVARAQKHRKLMGSRYIECHTLLPPSLAMQSAHGAIGMQAARGPYMPPGIRPATAMPGPAMLPLQAAPQHLHPGAFMFDGSQLQGQGVRAQRFAYGIPHMPGSALVPFGIPQPYSPQQQSQPGPLPRPPTAGHGMSPQRGEWRGTQPASPGAQLSPQQSATSAQLAGLRQQQQQQQQMLLQHHFLMQQQALLQQQATSQLRHPGWAIPAGPAFMAPYPTAIRPQPMHRMPAYPKPSPLPSHPKPSRSQQSRFSESSLQPETDALRANNATQMASSSASEERDPGQAVPNSRPYFSSSGQEASPASSLQSDMQSLTLASRAQSTASGGLSVPRPPSPRSHAPKPSESRAMPPPIPQAEQLGGPQSAAHSS